MDYNTVSKQISDLVGNESANMDKQQQALQGQYGYQDAYNNLQGIRRNVSDTQSALDALPEQLQQRTAGSLTTAGQLGRLTATESDPIAKQLATLNSTQTNQQLALGDINKMIDTGMSRYQQSYGDQLNALQQQQAQIHAAQLQQQAQAAAVTLARQQHDLAAQDAAAAQTKADADQITKFGNMKTKDLLSYIQNNYGNLSQDLIDKGMAIYNQKNADEIAVVPINFATGKMGGLVAPATELASKSTVNSIPTITNPNFGIDTRTANNLTDISNTNYAPPSRNDVIGYGSKIVRPLLKF